jgi:TPP-dependent pyruvate/acetoin dehydrogenase alpha subunit
MALIREFETAVAALYRDGEIPGFVHVSLGQEAVAAGVCGALAPGDRMATTHRGHGHCLAKGVDLEAMMAELFARAAGLCHGKGGSMHVADPRHGILGANAIVGASLPLATGAALSARVLGTGAVAVAFFGEGAVNQGVFAETLNLAAIWDLPVLFVCEDNRYAEFSDSRRMARVWSAVARAAAFGVDGEEVDGGDAEAVLAAALRAVEACRAGRGPRVLEAHTARWHGHYEGDGQPYRPAGELDEARQRDPLQVLGARLLARGEATPRELDALREAARDAVAGAVQRARTLPAPEPQEAFADVLAD